MNRVLILEDEYALAAALATLCRRLQLQPTVAATGRSGLEKIAAQAFDLVLLDIGLPDISGLEVMRHLQARHPQTAVLIITAHGTLENALESKRLGARDYFLKPLDLDLLRSALLTFTQQSPTPTPNPTPTAQSSLPSDSDTLMVGSAPEMQRFFADLSHAAFDRSPVWISGPPGSGKTHAARLLHRLGPTSSAALISWQWQNLDPTLSLPLPLSQHTGTLLLDLHHPTSSLELSALLNDLTSLPSSARIIVTSRHRPPALPLFSSHGHWHSLTLPALNDHKQDLRALAEHFIIQTGVHHPLRLSDAALARLCAHDWPGNSSELCHAIFYAVKASTPISLILPEHLPDSIPSTSPWSPGTPLPNTLTRAIQEWLDQCLPPSTATDGTQPFPTYQSLMDALEHPLLESLLAHFKGRPTHLAQALQINRTTLRNRFRELFGPHSPGGEGERP